MTLPSARRLARHVEPAVDEARVDRAWAAIAPRRSFALGMRPLPWVLAGAALLAGILVLARPWRASAPVAGFVVESGEADVLTFPDGSRMTLASGARVKCDRLEAARVETTLERGEVAFDVRHAEGRTFTVHAGGFDVVDRGTRFLVALSDGRVDVSVEEGSVVIVGTGTKGGPRVLAAGESWSSGPHEGPSAAAGPVAATATSASVESPDAAISEPAKPGDRTGTTAVPGGAGAPPTNETGPRELLAEAQSARLAGKPRDAAAALDALRKRFRADSRAGLAAFDLGRLRLDSLGDPAGALDAFDDAISLAPSASFREDAEARRVEALDRMRDGRCAAAKRAYLAHYPNGVYAAAVGSRCSP
jgi:transmembrane sensor